MTALDELNDDLAKRGADYGPFWENSIVFQKIRTCAMDALASNPRFHKLSPRGKATLDHGISMIATKLARITTGDPMHHDSWKDIMGYANIIDRDLQLIEGPNQTIGEALEIRAKEELDHYHV